MKKLTEREKVDKAKSLLDNKYYHLSVVTDVTNINKYESWYLYKNYKFDKDFINKENKPILTSNKNTADELLSFAEKHKRYNLLIIQGKTGMFAAFGCLILSIINLYFHLKTLSGFIIGIMICQIINDIVLTNFDEKNFEVDFLERIENLNDKYISEIPNRYKCNFCRKVFELKYDDHYITHTNKGVSGVLSGADSYDAFDCPNCGCQNIVNKRDCQRNGDINDD